MVTDNGNESAPANTTNGWRTENGSGSLRERVQSLRLPPAAAAPRGNGKLAWLLCLAFAGLSGYLAVQLNAARTTVDPVDALQSAATSVAKPADTASNPSPPSTTTTGDIVLESKGYIIPAHQILVSPKVSGMIVRLFVEEGKRVAKGSVLAELEDIDYKADVERMQGLLVSAQQRLLELERGNRPEEVQQTKAELEEAESQRVQLEAEWKRNQRLRPSKAVTDHDFEIAESAFRAMQHRVEKLRNMHQLMVEGARQERILAARAEVKQAEADLVKVKWRLDNCTIRAPVSGTILKKNAEEGNIVNPIAFNGSYSLCDMADLSDLEVDLTIQERDVARVFKDQKCKIRADAFPERVYDGFVSRLMPIGDRAKGAIPVRVKVSVPANEEGVYLKPEMGATVTFFKAGK